MGLREWGICQREVYRLVSGLEIWPSPLRARPVIMSDILDGLRSYPLFTYSQVRNLGQPFFSPSIAQARTNSVGSKGLCMKNKHKPGFSLSVLFSAAFVSWKEAKNSPLSAPFFRPRCSFIAAYFIHTERTLTWICILLFFCPPSSPLYSLLPTENVKTPVL